MRLKTRNVIVIVIAAILTSTLNPAQAAIKPGSTCKKYGSAITESNKIYTCVKTGKKLIWKFTMNLSTPTPTPSPTLTLLAINDLSAILDVGTISYKFTNRNTEVAGTSFELGLSHLLDTSKDIKLNSSYSEVLPFRTFTTNSISLTLLEVKNFLASKTLSTSGISVMARVRVISGTSKSDWGNGIYLTSEQINFVPTPTQTFTPAPRQTYTPAPIPRPTYGSGSGGSRSRGLSGCTFNGKNLYGRVQIVDFFPDVTVSVASFFPDLRVQRVDMFANSCGRWQFVDMFPDFTIKFVDFFPDITIQFVDMFPGTR
jgi:hypothetical protein